MERGTEDLFLTSATEADELLADAVVLAGKTPGPLADSGRICAHPALSKRPSREHGTQATRIVRGLPPTKLEVERLGRIDFAAVYAT
jgi:hypothetical protein